ncbi:MAG: Uma2 family endonuclease [Microcystaceae cyanobacterium]
MVALLDSNFLTPEEYLAFEEKSLVKHEYRDGDAYAMAGTTANHNKILGSLYVLIRNHLRGSGCDPYFSDLKVKIQAKNCFYYPDLLVTCDRRDREMAVYKNHPKLIIEVLSDSTEAFDRGDKFIDYQSLESLEEYVLVNHKSRRVETFRRNAQNLWVLQTYQEQDQTFELQSLNLTINFIDLYEDVPLEPVAVLANNLKLE